MKKIRCQKVNQKCHKYHNRTTKKRKFKSLKHNNPSLKLRKSKNKNKNLENLDLSLKYGKQWLVKQMKKIRKKDKNKLKEKKSLMICYVMKAGQPLEM